MNRKQWQEALKTFAQPDHSKVAGQVLNTVLPYVMLLLAIMYAAKEGVGFLWLLLPSVIASGLVVRIFIFFHDCTHGSFTASKKWNDLLGNFFSFFVFTPYIQWKVEHSLHHSTVGNLDARGLGDIWTLTIEEFEAAGPWKKAWYRLFRHPAFLFTVAPVFKFVVIQRFPRNYSGSKEKWNYRKLNVALALYSLIMGTVFGWQTFLLYQLLIMGMAASAGVWMFYVQHQFEEVYWEEETSWNLLEAALQGSTYYKLPRVLEWFTGSIGYHHIHHLNARIPNYNLRACYQSISDLQKGKTVTVIKSLHLAFLGLYDARAKELISFRTYRRRLRMSAL